MEAQNPQAESISDRKSAGVGSVGSDFDVSREIVNGFQPPAIATTSGTWPDPILTVPAMLPLGFPWAGASSTSDRPVSVSWSCPGTSGQESAGPVSDASMWPLVPSPTDTLRSSITTPSPIDARGSGRVQLESISVTRDPSEGGSQWESATSNCTSLDASNTLASMLRVGAELASPASTSRPPSG